MVDGPGSKSLLLAVAECGRFVLNVLHARSVFCVSFIRLFI